MSFTDTLKALQSMRDGYEVLLEICEDFVDSSDGRIFDAHTALEAMDAAIDQLQRHGPDA